MKEEGRRLLLEKEKPKREAKEKATRNPRSRFGDRRKQNGKKCFNSVDSMKRRRKKRKKRRSGWDRKDFGMKMLRRRTVEVASNTTMKDEEGRRKNCEGDEKIHEKKRLDGRFLHSDRCIWIDLTIGLVFPGQRDCGDKKKRKSNGGDDFHNLGHPFDLFRLFDPSYPSNLLNLFHLSCLLSPVSLFRLSCPWSLWADLFHTRKKGDKDGMMTNARKEDDGDEIQNENKNDESLKKRKKGDDSGERMGCG